MSYVKRYFSQQKEHVIELNDGIKAVINPDKVVIGNKEFDRKTFRKWLGSLKCDVQCYDTIGVHEGNIRILIDIHAGKPIDVDELFKLEPYLNDNIDGER